MSDADKNSTHSPRFIVAAIALGVLLVAGVIVVVSILVGQGDRAHAIAAHQHGDLAVVRVERHDRLAVVE